MFEKFKEVKDSFKYLNPEKVFGGKCEVHEINSEAEDIRDALGITSERANKLADICIDARKTCRNSAEAGSKVSKECKHPNELFFCAQMLAEMLIKERMHEAKEKLMSQLKRGGLGGLKGFPGLEDL